MSLPTTGRCLRWLGALGVAALLGYLLGPALTPAPRAADDEKKKPPADVAKGPPPSSYDQVSKVLLGEEFRWRRCPAHR